MPKRVRQSILLASTILQSAALAGGAFAQDVSGSTDKPDSQELSTITVHATTAGQNDDHAGSADRAQSLYISRDDLLLTNPQNLKDVFAGEASVTVGGAMGTTQKVYVNSIDELNLAVTVDGVLQNNRVFHHNTTNYIDPTLLKSVRVDPGVAPADTGPGALAGSIVYETVDARDMLAPDQNIGGFTSVTFNTNGNTFTAAGSGYARHSGVEILGYAKYANGDDYKAGNGDEMAGTGADLLSLLAKGAYQSQEGHRFEFTGRHLKDDALRPYRANFGGIPSTEPETRVYNITERSFSGSYEIDGATGLFDPNVVIGYSESSTKVPQFFNRRSGTSIDIGSDGNAWTFSGKIENTFNLNELNNITAGVDFYTAESKYSDDIYSPEGYKEKANNIGFYAQARLQPIERLHLSFGARGDNQNFTGVDGTDFNNFGLSGNAYAAFDVTEQISINAGYSNVFGGIDLEENYIYESITSYEGLKPVRSQNLVAGVKFEHNGFTLSGDVFQTDFDNYREFRSRTVFNTDFKVKGFNLGAGYNWGAGFFRVTYSNSDLKVDGSHVDSYIASDIGAPIGQVIAAQLVHNFEKYGVTVGTSIDAALDYDATTDVGYQSLPGYFVANAFAEYTPKQLSNLTLRVEANNIFDETYASRGTYGVEYGTDTLTPLYEPGRSLLLKAKLKF